MSFKIGDYVREKNIIDSLIWQISSLYATSQNVLLEHNFVGGGSTFCRLPMFALDHCYIKVDMFGNPVKEDGDQLSWYDGFLVPGKENKEEKYCNHDWKVYNGLNFSDEYCTKCNKKREIEKK